MSERSVCRCPDGCRCHHGPIPYDDAAEPATAGGEVLDALWRSQSEWSQRTFGTDDERGPVGALRHLQREAEEAISAWDGQDDGLHEEVADCFLLVLDAARRSGLSLDDLVQVAADKQHINQQRAWPKPTDPREPVEHIEGGDGG